MRLYRIAKRLFQPSKFVVICRVEVTSRPSLRRPHTKHELVSIPAESVESSILLIRSQKVMLDRTLAKLYGVSTKVLNQAVKRNPERFPPDFMFQLSMQEAKAVDPTGRAILRSQIVTLKSSQGKNIKYRPYAFTEHGILMLSSVLKSERAVQVNIQIMRTFVRHREITASNAALTRRLDDLERNFSGRFKVVFEAIRQLMKPATPERKPIGFRRNTVKK